MLEQTIKIIKAAGNLVKDLQKKDTLSIEIKSDKSIVTNADKESENLIVDQILLHFGKNQCIISEEACSLGNAPEVKNNQPFWLIDPIDSTASYANKLNDYCINIAYLENHLPAFGLIYAPNLNTLWYAEKNKGSFKQIGTNPATKIHVRKIQTEAVAVTSSKGHHLDESLIEKYNIKKELVVASAIKFCYIAEGKADYYFRKRNRACDWDIVSGDLIVTEAGGEVIMLDDNNYKYGNAPFLAPSLIVKGRNKQ